MLDTNLGIDVLTDDPHWADWSLEQLAAYGPEGLVINPMIYAEFCFGAPSIEFVDDIVRRFSLSCREIPCNGLYRAAKAFGQYKVRKGAKGSVLPDFFIGGHAEAAGFLLPTREPRRIRSCFPAIQLIHPL
jgi:predicted nucleic acid-binding protein